MHPTIMETPPPPPPASVASSEAPSDTTATPEIKQMLHTTCEALNDEPAHGIRAIHLVAPHSSGKTMYLVPRVWDHIRSMRPETRVTYVQESQYEATAAAESFDEMTGSKGYALVGDVNLEGTAPASCGKLLFTWYERLRSALVDKLDNNKYVTPETPLVFIIDLEKLPTVRGQVSIGLLLEYLSRLSRHYEQNTESGNHLDVTIITLAVEEAPYIYKWFNEQFGMEIKKIVAAPSQPAVQRTNESKRSLRQKIAAMRTRQPNFRVSVVAFTSNQEDMDFLGLASSFLHGGSTRGEIESAISKDEDYVICIDPSFPRVLHLWATHFVAFDDKLVRVLHQDSSHFVLDRVSISDSERRWEDAWELAARSFTNGVGRGISTLYTTHPAQAKEIPLEADLMYLVWYLCRHWGLCRWCQVPIPYINDIRLNVIDEMRHRLQAMDLVRASPTVVQRVVLTERGRAIEKWLYSPHNTSRSIQLACFLTRIDALRQGLSNKRGRETWYPAIRVMIRLAVIIEHGVHELVEVNKKRLKDPDLVQTSKPLARLLVRYIQEDAVGPAQDLVGCGALWVALGLWHKHYSEHGIHNEPSVVQMAKSTMLLDVEKANLVARDVALLENKFSLENVSHHEELASTAMGPEHEMFIFKLLLTLYIHHQVRFHKSLKTPMDMASVRIMDMKEPNLHALIDDDYFGDQQASGKDFTAIYTSMVLDRPGHVAPADLTVMPNQAHVALNQQIKSSGAPQLLVSMSARTRGEQIIQRSP
jgi:hypothetical protein